MKDRGRRVQVEPGFDRQLLSDVLAVLEERPVLNRSLTVKVCLCTLPTDMRHGFDELMRMAEEHLQRNVLKGGLLCLVARSRCF